MMNYQIVLVAHERRKSLSHVLVIDAVCVD